MSEKRAWESCRLNELDELRKLVPPLSPDTKVLHKQSAYHSLLMCACAHGSTDCAKYLLEAGASPNLKNYNGYTALHWASFTGRTEAVELLLDNGANIESRTADGKTALHVAAFKGHRHIAEILLKRGADLNAVDARGWNCVRSAALDNQQAMVEYLKMKGIDMDPLDTEKRDLASFAQKFHIDWLAQFM